jgi:hypothetical protein
VHLIAPHLALFVVDTVIRLADKVVPMLANELVRRSAAPPTPRRVERGFWAIGQRLYIVNSRTAGPI